MTDAAVVGRILREYRLGPASVRRRYGSVSGPRVGYQVEWPGAAMDARLGRLRDRLAVSQAVADLAAR